MAELPSLVRVKRKRGEDPTPDLFLEDRSTKRSQTWQFRLQQPHPNDVTALEAQSTIDQVDGAERATKQADELRATRRREFRLAIDKERLSNIGSRKRKAQIDVQDIPTFIEATSKKQRLQSHITALQTDIVEKDAKPTSGFKRPSANANEKKWRAETWKQPGTTQSQSMGNPPSQKMVDALSTFALEEATRDEARHKPKVTSIPKRPVQRYRDRHPEEYAAQIAQKHAHAVQQDVEMDVDESDDDDYVYDTYVRTRDPVMLPTMDKEDSARVQIGYLVITEQDQPFWETYFEDDGSDKEFDTDDEDENGKPSP